MSHRWVIALVVVILGVGTLGILGYLVVSSSENVLPSEVGNLQPDTNPVTTAPADLSSPNILPDSSPSGIPRQTETDSPTDDQTEGNHKDDDDD